MILDWRNYLSLMAGLTLIQFPIYAWIIEKMAAAGCLPNKVVFILVVSYLTAMLVYPIVIIQWIESEALPGTYIMLFAVSLFLKFTSFHHVCYDNRLLMKRIKQAKESKETEGVEDLATFFNVNE